jgi:hypothetical protein
MMTQFKHNIFQPNLGLVVSSEFNNDNSNILDKTQEYIKVYYESGIVYNLNSMIDKLISYFDINLNLYFILYIGNIDDCGSIKINNETLPFLELLKFRNIKRDLILILVNQNSYIISERISCLNLENLYVQTLYSIDQLYTYWNIQNNPKYKYSLDKHIIPKYYKPSILHHKWNNFKNIIFIGDDITANIITPINPGTLEHRTGKCFPCTKYKIDKISCKYDKYCKYCHHPDHANYKKENQAEKFKTLKTTFIKMRHNNFDGLDKRIADLLIIGYDIQNIIDEELKKLENEYIIKDDTSLIILTFSEMIRSYGEKIRNCVPNHDTNNFYTVVQDIKIVRGLNKRCTWISGIIHSALIKLNSTIENDEITYFEIRDYILELTDKIKNTTDEWLQKRLHIISICKRIEDKYSWIQKLNMFQLIQNTLKYKTANIDTIYYYLNLIIEYDIVEITSIIERFEEFIILGCPKLTEHIKIKPIYINIYSVNRMRGIWLHWKNIIDSWCTENELVQKLVDLISVLHIDKKNIIVNILDSIIYLDYINCIYNNTLLSNILNVFEKLQNKNVENIEYINYLTNIIGCQLMGYNKISSYLHPLCMFISDKLRKLKNNHLYKLKDSKLTNKIYSSILRELRIFPEIIQLINNDENQSYFDIHLYLYTSDTLETLLFKLRSLRILKNE